MCRAMQQFAAFGEQFQKDDLPVLRDVWPRVAGFTAGWRQHQRRRGSAADLRNSGRRNMMATYAFRTHHLIWLLDSPPP